MAIKQRKQLTGTTAQINAYAGVEGQLVWDKTKKKWVGMSGTAGTNYPMASESHTHSISNVTNLQSTLDGKQPKGDYATTTALTDGLAGKANKAHTHAIADVTNLQTTLNVIQGKIPTKTSQLSNIFSAMIRFFIKLFYSFKKLMLRHSHHFFFPFSINHLCISP